MYLEKIDKPNDIKKIDKKDYQLLAHEIRRFLIEKVSLTGGHLASNLGAVELTMAIHLVCDFPNDKVIWDVGHQSYTHKILTGRKDGFNNMRSFGGMSGFPKRKESECDAFNTGHSSTAISAGLGIVTGNMLNNNKSTVISVIGDGALTGGMCFEALNNAARLKRNFIIILNDNEMSISHNVGGISKYLNNIRVGETYNDIKAGVETTLNKVPVVGTKLINQIKKTKSSIKSMVVPGMLFEDMGITYIGPVDGHNIQKMVKILKEAKKLDHPVIIHVLTKKGKGYAYAENEPSRFHGIEPFYPKTGKLKSQKNSRTYTDVVSKKLLQLADNDKNIVAITAAMPDGTGLSRFAQKYPERFFDVGIAEEHAVTFAAGLSTTGLKPFVAIYSSFLQRAYDQIIHDVCIQKLPVTFLIDRAGLVGKDGETHQGIFDIAFLRQIPNMTIISPSNSRELEQALDFAYKYDKPLAIRYPRGEALEADYEIMPYEYGKSSVIRSGSDVAIISVGNMIEIADKVCDNLKLKGIQATLADARFIKPVDGKLINNLAADHSIIVTIEEGVLNGGYGENIAEILSDNLKTKTLSFGIDDIFVEHGDISVLRNNLGLNPDTITNKILEELE